MFEEWKNLNVSVDKDNPFSFFATYENGDSFYVEPAFYTQLSNFKEMYSFEDYERILKKMEELVHERKRIIFTYDYEHPLTKNDDYILLEFTDITDLLNIYIEDKSRGSDYGD